jgi:hypothetical protein
MDHYTQGFIPGPAETKEQFEKRVAYCLTLRSILPDGADADIPQQKAFLNESTSLYKLSPDWVPLIFANHKLAPWHGGCAWIFQMDESAPLGAFLQLRNPFKNNKKYLGIYDRQELITHEICHVARMAFEEPVFEEHLAYRTSDSKWRRWIGPIIRNSIESMFFFLSLLLVFGSYLFALFIDPSAWAYVPYFFLLPLTLCLFALLRLSYEHRCYNKTLSKFKNMDAPSEQMMLWLTDEEIKKFGTQSTAEILEYIKTNSSFRMQSFASRYFSI